MVEKIKEPMENIINLDGLSQDARNELMLLGALSQDGQLLQAPAEEVKSGARSIQTDAISAPSVLNEAFCYSAPSAFSRGLKLELENYTVLLISGTASVDEEGRSVYVGDFKAQSWRTYRNISTLLTAEGANWHDIVKTTCYLRDIERDYKEFNEVRTSFFEWLKLDPLPASVGIQARLCREDLLVEIEAMAILKRG